MTAGDKPRRRHVSDEERALWRSITRTIKPLKRHRPAPDEPEESVAPEPKARPAAGKPRPSPAPPVMAVQRPAPKEPALAPIDRRARQKLARGTQAIDARLDLHGRTQGQAHAALLRFLRNAQADGARTVLVITGMGAAGGERSERGVLRRQVPLWLSLPEFRTLVVGFGDAAIGHGGDGALYVRVRRER